MRPILPALLCLVACAQAPVGLKRLEAPAFREAVEAGQGLLVDVRTPEEHREVRIKGIQRHVPLQELEGRLAELPRDRPLLIYCRSGNRSAKAAAILLKAGFQDVRHLEGGIGAWKAKGYAIEP